MNWLPFWDFDAQQRQADRLAARTTKWVRKMRRLEMDLDRAKAEITHLEEAAAARDAKFLDVLKNKNMTIADLKRKTEMDANTIVELRNKSSEDQAKFDAEITERLRALADKANQPFEPSGN